MRMENSKVALITGGAKRIGESISRAFHAKGYEVLIHFNNSSDESENLEAELNGMRNNSCKTLYGNFFDKESTKGFSLDVLSATNRLDVLVNNASTFFPTRLEEASDDNLNNLFQTNAFVPFFLIKSFAPLLKESLGSVINISDAMVGSGIKEYSLYAAAKASLESLTKSLSKELAPSIRVNCVAPGIILWPEVEELSDEDKDKLIKKTSLQRAGSPEDIANAVIMIHESNYMTGQILNVDGGRES